MSQTFAPSTPPLSGAQAASPLVSVEGVTLQYKTPDHLVTATYRVSFDIHSQERVVLLGPSGCGKSTILKAIAGFMPPVEGRVTLKGSVIAGPGPDRMMVFQEFDQLLPWKTVQANVAYPMLVNGVSRDEAAHRAADALTKVNLAKFMDAYPHMLSGGMKQRVAIARGMAMEPDILLMDEPFAALDSLTRLQMQDELMALWQDTKFTVMFVTHSISEAVKIGSRILLMSPHPGRIRAELNDLSGDRKELEDQIYTLLFGHRPKEVA